MKPFVGISILFVGLFLISGAAFSDQAQLYGRVYLFDGEEIEGYIRWDKNEGFWDDILDGNKELDRKTKRKYGRRDDDEDRRGREISIFGVTIYSEHDNVIWKFGNEAQSGIRMGHIEELIPTGDDEVTLLLKSGIEIELSEGSGDIGTENREILVEDSYEGVMELYWDDIDHIKFLASPGYESNFGKRLYGTVTTRRGDEYTGYICWDMDEIFDADILDGKEGRRNREIEFSNIKTIERRSSNSSIVTLKNGKEIRLSDSNDIDSGNRGITVSDLNLGRIKIYWDEFDMIEFSDPPEGPSYNSFDGGRKIQGSVLTEEGEKFTGEIKWDLDEEYTWEILDGNYYDIEFDIEFAFIKSIEKTSYHSSRVTLKDGRSFKLRDSNDIDGENKGILIITADKDEILIDWDEFDMVEFTH